MQKKKTKTHTVLNSFSGLSSSRRHLQSGTSLSGSLRGINSDLLVIPPAPLPPTSVPPHMCTLGVVLGGGGVEMNGDLMDDEDDDDDEDVQHQQQQHSHQHYPHQHSGPGIVGVSSSFMNGGGGGVGSGGIGVRDVGVEDRFSSGDSV